MAAIILDEIEKTYPNGFHAIHKLGLEVQDGEFLVLVGPSGCGKSTTLRMIAGLEAISGGEVRIGDRVVNNDAPRDRDIAMVFQNYALYPHMTVRANIGFALKLAKVPKAEIARRVEEAASILEMTAQLDKKPAQLSGGQRQRVAMGRAFVRQPAAFLMDEPLSNLDAKLRVQMRAEISQLQRQVGVTTIYVTHDQIEAMTMGDRVAVLKDGHLQQIDSPARLYSDPVNVFVAAFIGSPSMNLYEAELAEDHVQLGVHKILLPPTTFERRRGLRERIGGPVVLGIRPENLEDASLVSKVRVGATIPATVQLTESLGSEIVVHFGIEARTVDPGDPDIGDEVGVGNAVGRFDPRSSCSIGDRVDVAVDADALHFFDINSHMNVSKQG